MPWIVRILSAIGRLLSGGFGRIISLLKNIANINLLGIFNLLKEFFKKILSKSINFTGWMVLVFEAFKKLLGVIGVGTAIGSGALGVKQLFDFTKAVINPQEQMLDWLSSAFSSLPSVNTIIADIDTLMANVTSSYFSPPITMTYLLQITGIGQAFNQYLQALVSTLIFVFSVWIVKWAFSQNFTFTKSVP